ncbi:coenzyme F420-0:L-glutamate ligase [Gammaproteobacteria bacterium]|jgi:coenzyme F420-0:L-glutamate ligase/coenzyme F420-1:gamma-L-glutamate ligase|nr:coenzyme F420-0:L-glutamate ligase [Gammaproteobacteria bacterium]MDA9265835.1 coenzyme F420-0:L-glutamate ligase [Gammaproteobacteria bacterium]MDC1190542.1 coenzyme F420-0:L-glutamate ligase [Gammaproteobacteria bacterium]
MDHLNLIALKKFPLIEPGDHLNEIILKSISDNNLLLEDGDILIIAQKIISKAENRYINLDDVIPSQSAIDLGEELNRNPAFIQLILNESKSIISTEKNVIIVEHNLGFIHINAGIDRSNIPQDENLVLLLPIDPSSSAEIIQSFISKSLNINISVVITDSMSRPYRSGVTNFALASANIQSLIDLKGESDIYGNTLKSTEIAIADELAAAAGLLMGQGDELKPVILMKGFSKSSYGINDALDLTVDEKNDLYR